jgi:hypothetical protein
VNLAAELEGLAREIEAEAARVRDSGDPTLALGMFGWGHYLRLRADRLRASQDERKVKGVEAADSRALKIAKSKTPRGRAPEVQALYDAGLTPQSAAEACGTTRDVLKQAWGHGKQFRPIRPEWRRKLAALGVPESVWRDRP